MNKYRLGFALLILYATIIFATVLIRPSKEGENIVLTNTTVTQTELEDLALIEERPLTFVQSTYTIESTTEETTIAELETIEETTVISETTTEPLSKYSDYELDYLYRCVESEAGNQGLYGKQLVACVILNRVEDSNFPNNIIDVINATDQFEVVANGYINEVTVSQETIDAVTLELENRTNYNIFYFRTDHYHTFGTPILQYNDHYFSGK